MSRFQLKLARYALLALLVVLALAGCTRRSASLNKDLDIELSLIIRPDPARVGQSVFEIELKSESGEAITGAELALRGDMTHAGMIPVMADVKEVQPGIYQSSLEWTMAGDWVLTIEGTLPDGSVLSRQIDVRVSP